MTICILGRQPEIGLAELEALYGATAVRPAGEQCALVDAPVVFARLGGSSKAAELVATLHTTSRSGLFKELARLVPTIVKSMPAEGKIKLGLSVYGIDISPYDLGGEALRLKKSVRSLGRSVRVVPNEHPALSSAQTYHNSLATDLGIELVLVRDGSTTLVGRVTDVQNIDAYRIRDRERPKRDAFVGMLPPKLAQCIINLATSDLAPPATLLDPFCGTGVVLQEALLMGYQAYGSDISKKMIDYTGANLAWLKNGTLLTTKSDVRLETADATDHIWRQPVSAIACEGYLGQPIGGQQISAEKLREIIHDSNATMRGFLKNIAPQLTPGTRLCIAMPAWFVDDTVHHVPVINELEELGFERVSFNTVPGELIYRREDQTTGRELVVMKKR